MTLRNKNRNKKRTGLKSSLAQASKQKHLSSTSNKSQHSRLGNAGLNNLTSSTDVLKLCAVPKHLGKDKDPRLQLRWLTENLKQSLTSVSLQLNQLFELEEAKGFSPRFPSEALKKWRGVDNESLLGVEVEDYVDQVKELILEELEEVVNVTIKATRRKMLNEVARLIIRMHVIASWNTYNEGEAPVNPNFIQGNEDAPIGIGVLKKDGKNVDPGPAVGTMVRMYSNPETFDSEHGASGNNPKYEEYHQMDLFFDGDMDNDSVASGGKEEQDPDMALMFLLFLSFEYGIIRPLVKDKSFTEDEQALMFFFSKKYCKELHQIRIKERSAI